MIQNAVSDVHEWDMERQGTPLMKKIIFVLTLIMAVLAISCCVLGIFSKEKNHYPAICNAYGQETVLYQIGLYGRDSVSMASQAVAQDRVTLFVGVPFLLFTLYMAMKFERKWFLFLAGIVGYFFYAYIPYATMVAYNNCFLLYIMLMAVGLYNFILCMIQISKTEFPADYFKYFPVRILAVYEAVTGLLLCFMWLSRIITAACLQTAPIGLEHYSTLTIQALDLAVIVPVSFICAYLLVKGNRMGYILCIVLQVKGIAMAMAVTAMNIEMVRNGVTLSIMELSFFPVIVLTGIAFLLRICLGIRKREREIQVEPG